MKQSYGSLVRRQRADKERELNVKKMNDSKRTKEKTCVSTKKLLHLLFYTSDQVWRPIENFEYT